MAQYTSPTGSEIVGTKEFLTGCAKINGIDPATGKPEHAGETEVFWDDQSTMTMDGKIVFLDDNGAEWTFDQLTEVKEEPEPQPEAKRYRITIDVVAEGDPTAIDEWMPKLPAGVELDLITHVEVDENGEEIH